MLRPPDRFTTWRRTRPFWAGLLVCLGGVFLLAPPLAPLGLMLHQGAAATSSLLLSAILVVGGLFLWFAPQQRHFVGIVCALCSVISFVTSNLGGFGLGAGLGLLGAAMAFGWVTDAPAGPAAKIDPPAGTGGSRTHAMVAGLLGFVLLGPPGQTCWTPPGNWPDWLSLPGTTCATKPSDLVPAPAGEDPVAPRNAEQDGIVRAVPRVAPPASAPKIGRSVPMISADRLDAYGLTVRGRTTLRSAAGPVTVLALHADRAVLTDYRLTTGRRDPRLSLSFDIDVRDVDIYATRLAGTLGLDGVGLRADLTPDLVPASLPVDVTVPRLTIEDVDVGEALIVSPTATFTGLRLRADH